MIKWRNALLTGFLLFLLGGCLDENAGDFVLLTYKYDFSKEPYAWKGDFSDYSISDSASYSFKFAYTDLPVGFRMNQKSLLLRGKGRKNGLFMFIKTKIDSLQENTEYTIAYNVEFVSNASSIFYSANADETATVLLKAGASPIEPIKFIDGRSYNLNIDKGQQNSSGSNMILIGDISREQESDSDYTLLSRRNTQSFSAVTNDDGELWLIVGLDSTLEDITSIYFTNISVVLSITK